ncbi:MAG TPA: Ig-like domain-containing protein, partial [Candidatus Ozemobacteraceae bacterium]|nr:Ig-like domain-containing protein [Candidatus Ozemobacteraceae bacterium]
MATGSSLPEGLVAFTAADLAQNFATGPVWFQLVQVDASQPVVIGITPSTALGGSPVHTAAAQATFFDVEFSEPMSSGTVPAVKLVNGAFQWSLTASPTAPACWISSTTCRFTHTQPITATYPQGLYNYVVTGGRDYAGNTAVTSNGVFQLEVQSRGPIVTSYLTQSQQATTASGTPWPTLDNQPFSFLVAPNAATLTVTLSTASGTVNSRVHFVQGNVTVASVSVNWDGTSTIGTFTWDSATGPIPVNGSPYTLKFYDEFNNVSLETGIWTMDATAPRVLATPTVSDTSTTTQVLYYSPSVTPNVNFAFRSDETSGLRVRLTGMGATDTWSMNKQPGTLWTASFNGRFSNSTIATDGAYQFDVVDVAGNLGTASAGIGTSVAVIVDTIRPIVSSYTLRAGGVGPIVTRFSTLAASLSIELTLDPSSPYGQTGVWEVDVLNDSGQVINRLPLIASGANYVAWWNGTNFSGTTVLDGTYTFRARDAAGNKATLTSSVFAVTTPFKMLGGEQVSSTAIRLFFNHPVDPLSLPTAVSFFNPATVTVSSYTLETAQNLIASLSGPLSHGVSYSFAIATLTLRNLDGSPLAAGQNSFTFTADAAGPGVANPAVTFTGITTAREFFVNFNEVVTAPTAVATANYVINGGAIPVTVVSLQTNRTSVRVTTAADLVSGTNYTLVINGVEDVYHNLSAINTTFQGRDMVAPVFSVGVFSNPANEYDLIVAATVNEALAASPKSKVMQNGAPSVEYTMTPGTLANSYMSGAHLDPNYPGAGWVEISGTDVAGNLGTTLASFTLAVVNASIRAEVKSSDGQFTSVFAAGSVKQKTAVKWLPRGNLTQNAAANVLVA